MSFLISLYSVHVAFFLRCPPRLSLLPYHGRGYNHGCHQRCQSSDGPATPAPDFRCSAVSGLTSDPPSERHDGLPLICHLQHQRICYPSFSSSTILQLFLVLVLVLVRQRDRNLSLQHPRLLLVGSSWLVPSPPPHESAATPIHPEEMSHPHTR